MLLRIPALLTPDELRAMRERLQGAAWADGKATAGYQSSLVKHNQQLAEDDPLAKELRKVIVSAMRRHDLVTVGAMPLFIFPPLFNRYETGMGFGDHVDNAVRGLLLETSGRMRTDVSATVFLSAPEEYEGGELVVEGAFGKQRIKLPAGDAIIYPASSVHRVEPVRSGVRLASILWMQSMVRNDGQRALLYDLDVVIGNLRKRGMTGEPEVVMLAGVYHNLMRMWLEM